MAHRILLNLLILLFSSLHLVLCQNSKCGSLITYRQHSVLLSEAPLCFRNGCNSRNTNSTATTISSPCPVEAPCSKLWGIIRGKFQQDWCESCHGDIACRIDGWPILNMTEACNVSPGDWIFAGNGGCCSSSDEPFQIAKWIQTLCNGSEWRTPFSYYGGMAKEDWAEWIEPWNWTLRPQNTSTYNITTDRNCNSSAFLWTWGYENITRAGSFFAYAVLVILFKSKFETPDYKWYRAIGGGVSEFIAILSSTIGAVIAVKNTPGYQDTPFWNLLLLISSRPSILGFLCSIGILAFILEERQLDRRYPNYYVSLYAANTCAGFAICEALQQILGGFYLWRTADVGRQKGFFHVKHLTPYWHGSEAQRMYAGGLLWTILSPFTIIGFVALAALQVHRLYIEPPVLNHGRISKLFRSMIRIYLRLMNILYAKKWQHQDNQAHQQQEMAEAPRPTDRLLPEGVQPEQETPFGQPGTRTGQTEGGPVADDDTTQPATPRTPNSFSRMFNRQPFLWIRQLFLWIGRITTRFFRILFNHRPFVWIRQLFLWVGRLAYLFLTSEPLNCLVTLPYIHVFADDIGPNNQPINPTGLEAITRQYRINYPPTADAQPVEDTMRFVRVLVTFSMLILWAFNYISQWLFWSGFVQSSGPRWCPPNNEVAINKVRIILIILSWFGITLNFAINLPFLNLPILPPAV